MQLIFHIFQGWKQQRRKIYKMLRSLQNYFPVAEIILYTFQMDVGNVLLDEFSPCPFPNLVFDNILLVYLSYLAVMLTDIALFGVGCFL